MCSSALLSSVGEPRPVEGPPCNPTLKASALRSRPFSCQLASHLLAAVEEGEGQLLESWFWKEWRLFNTYGLCQ